ncbi:MAG: exonuclease SbcCD subunit D C-terminal domain-containing protein [Bacteroidales bacterium]|nr:exonuclease SbcCD subunit D C-terminal domain-containing protein [Bacteroidales bacterium]
MKILHTSDWHIGQLFYEYDRTYEHQKFLNWLVEIIKNEKTDVLLISGDVFDLSNPAAASIKLFYTFLNQAVKGNPDLQIVIIAGNHDSASRLESPKPLLESSNIHIVGLLDRNEDGLIDYEKFIIPLKDSNGLIKVWCLAVPFLRMGDYPMSYGSRGSYAEGVVLLYESLYHYAKARVKEDQTMIAMSHLHALNATLSDHDKTERLIMGGVEYIPATAFHEDLKYVALGHIHKAQRIGGKEHIRYSGSPLPMSFSEQHYQHQVVVFELINGEMSNLQTLEVPPSVPLLRLPRKHQTLQNVIAELDALPQMNENPEMTPYLEVRVLLDGPEPALRHKIETAIEGKDVRLAKIDVKYPDNAENENAITFIAPDNLNELKAIDVFSRVYQKQYNSTIPDNLLKLFNEVENEVIQAGE